MGRKGDQEPFAELVPVLPQAGVPVIVWFEFTIRRMHISVAVNHAGKDVELAGRLIDQCREAEALSVIVLGVGRHSDVNITEFYVSALDEVRVDRAGIVVLVDCQRKSVEIRLHAWEWSRPIAKIGVVAVIIEVSLVGEPVDERL
jgi:hypothetical protein